MVERIVEPHRRRTTASEDSCSAGGSCCGPKLESKTTFWLKNLAWGQTTGVHYWMRNVVLNATLNKNWTCRCRPITPSLASTGFLKLDSFSSLQYW